MEKERINRILKLISQTAPSPSTLAIDLGCGYGELTRLLYPSVKTVWALDISSLALTRLNDLPKEKVVQKRDCLPFTKLPDRYFDLVLCTDLIGYLPENEQRALFAEQVRICKKEGWVICSAALDIYTEGALERFIRLAETELEIQQPFFSYHRLWIRLNDLMKNSIQKAKQHDSKFKWFWHKLLLPITLPLFNTLQHSRRLLGLIEKVTKAIWYEDGISHVVILAKPRNLIESSSFKATEGSAFQGKKRVWE